MFEDIRQLRYTEDYPTPEISSKEALVKVHYCGICGSDITNYKTKMYQTPLIMGHELSGEIVQIGEEIRDFKIGDRVCGINVKLDISKGELGGLGIFQDGGFAEFVKVPEKYLFSIPEGLSYKEAIMIESFANITRGIKLSEIPKNQSIMIIGGGNIGLCFLDALLAEKVPENIVVIEPHEFLRKKAKKFGATAVFPPNKIKIKRFFKKTSKPSYIFDCVGKEETLKMAIDLIERGGTILLEGIHKGTIDFPMFLINSKEIGLKGCLGHDRDDILASIELIKNKKIQPSKFISKVVPLEDIENAFKAFLESKEREFIKIAVRIK
ncbi:MAG: putative L-iditol 2-dehydrogenase [Promethearchaeota archaeon]|nr:MAG: putative L-iditol 2-dehydrogenase [Candidatus Lokiarchaeota archaeon]